MELWIELGVILALLAYLFTRRRPSHHIQVCGPILIVAWLLYWLGFIG